MLTVSTEINKYQQRIYNAYLRATAAADSRPFRLGKRWDNLPDLTTTALIKLEKFFKKHTEVNIETFFMSPFKIYNDVTFYPISFYTTLKAINLYKLYKKQVENQ